MCVRGGVPEDTTFSVIEVTGYCEPPGRFWDPSSSPLQKQKQQVLLTTAPSLQHQPLMFKNSEQAEYSVSEMF